MLTVWACARELQLLSRGCTAVRVSSMRCNAAGASSATGSAGPARCMRCNCEQATNTQLHAVSRRKACRGRTVASCWPMQFWRPSLKGNHRIAPEGVRFTALTERPSCQRAGRHRFASRPHAALLWCSAQGGISTQVPAWQLRFVVAVVQARSAVADRKHPRGRRARSWQRLLDHKQDACARQHPRDISRGVTRMARRRAALPERALSSACSRPGLQRQRCMQRSADPRATQFYLHFYDIVICYRKNFSRAGFMIFLLFLSASSSAHLWVALCRTRPCRVPSAAASPTARAAARAGPR